MRSVLRVVGAIALFGAVQAAAQGQGEIDVRVELTPPSIPFHKQATFTIVVEAPAALDVQLPDMRDHFGDLQVDGMPDHRSETVAEGRVRVTETYVLDPVKIRDHVFAPVEVKWGDGSVLAVPSPMFRARDLTPEELEEAQRFEAAVAGGPGAIGAEPLRALRWWALGAAPLVLALVGLLIWRLAAPPPEAAAVEPWELARERLATLAARKLPQQGRCEAYYVDLSAVLRYYIEGRIQVRAPERTTPEFLDEIVGQGHFTPEQEVFLARFLRLCDRVKFAQFRPDLEEMARSLEQVEQFVEDTIPVAQTGQEAAAA